MSTSIIITVADINDHAPAFQGPFARTIPENFTLVDTVWTGVQPRGSLCCKGCGRRESLLGVWYIGVVAKGVAHVVWQL